MDLLSNFSDSDTINAKSLEERGLTSLTARQFLFKSVKKGKLIRISRGLYMLNKPLIPEDLIDKAIEARFLLSKKKTIGYFAGKSLAFSLGLIPQKPSKPEIVSNKARISASVLKIQNYAAVIRKPKAKIDESKWRVLQLLDFFSDKRFRKVLSSDRSKAAIGKYIKDIKLSISDLLPYLSKYKQSLYRLLIKEGYIFFFEKSETKFDEKDTAEYFFRRSAG